MNLQLLHSSASLSINENWNPEVRDDMEMVLNRLLYVIFKLIILISRVICLFYNGILNTYARINMKSMCFPLNV